MQDGDAQPATTMKEGSHFVIVEEDDQTLDVEKQFQIYEEEYRQASKEVGNRNRRLKSAKVKNTDSAAAVTFVGSQGRGRPVSSYGKKQSQGQPGSAQLSFHHQQSTNNESIREVTGAADSEFQGMAEKALSKSNKRYIGSATKRRNVPIASASSEYVFRDNLRVRSINEAVVIAQKIAEDKKFRQLEKLRIKSRKARDKRKASAKLIQSRSSQSNGDKKRESI